MPTADKRAHERYEVELDVDLVRGETNVGARTINLSRGGMLLRAPTDPPLAVGQRVRLTFRVPDLEAPIGCDADVRWRNRVDATEVGVQFTSGLRAKEVWALGRLLERLRNADAD